MRDTIKSVYIQVQEILFEKYWNEIKSLAIVNKHDGKYYSK